MGAGTGPGVAAGRARRRAGWVVRAAAVCAVALLAAAGPGAPAAGAVERAPGPAAAGHAVARLDVDITVTEEGAVRVREEVTLRLGGPSARPVRREIPARGRVGGQVRPLGLTGVRVADDAGLGPVAVTATAAATTVRLGGAPTAPTASPTAAPALAPTAAPTDARGPRTVVLHYRYDRLLSALPGGRTRLEHALWPTGGTLPVDRVRARLGAAGGVAAAECRAGAPGARRPCAAEPGDQRAEFTAGPLRAGEGLLLAATLPPGAAAVPGDRGADAPTVVWMVGVGAAVFAILLMLAVAERRAGAARPAPRRARRGFADDERFDRYG
ncbi:DUF2207 domain-containing protein [Streptomonospora sp. S1-112]|uniref:DUF2207 domain-containing protein n=1 Tax=Streptomonospora mangrovi TaxID=2883123 RepID=A0A9X3SFK8_9ACTN|nr:DUF2207 domain-containing protein [Streptomonospora mangrovi]MDA0566052.1 DUF2207 domain-containing protein [Streptomonospora mangrovi]